MDQDVLLPNDTCECNVLESLLGISNLYSKYSQMDMVSGAHHLELGMDHASSRKQIATPGISKKDSMKAKFVRCGVQLKWVILFPHVNDFNGRDPGQNFLGFLSHTVVHDGRHHSWG